MSPPFEEPTIPPRLQRPLAALWISLGLHVVIIALIQVAPPTAKRLDEPVIEARLVSAPAPPVAPVALETPPGDAEAVSQDASPKGKPELGSSGASEALPVAKPVQPLPEQAKAITPPPQPTVANLPESQPAPVAAPQVATKTAPEISMSTSVDLTYYSARELDVQPHALNRIEPDYPPEADRQKVSGKVRLQLKLEADGRVSQVEVVSANPPGLFEASAIKAFRDARFAAALRKGRPVRALFLVEVEYDWKGHSGLSEDSGNFKSIGW